MAAILTYARRAWEHGADPVTVEKVAETREAFAERETPWTAKELLKMK